MRAWGLSEPPKAVKRPPSGDGPAGVISQEWRHPCVQWDSSCCNHKRTGSGGFEVVLVGPIDCRNRRAARGLRSPVNSRLGDWVYRAEPARESVLEAGPRRLSQGTSESSQVFAPKRQRGVRVWGTRRWKALWVWKAVRMVPCLWKEPLVLFGPTGSRWGRLGGATESVSDQAIWLARCLKSSAWVTSGPEG
jgi:hypothetical protein